MASTVKASNLGFSRMGRRRELKRAVEGYWKGNRSLAELHQVAASIRADNWQRARAAGLDHISSNDFSFYDHVLDTAMMLGAVPHAYRTLPHQDRIDTYFAMARGFQDKARGVDVPALELTKWFDTNYHYIVPDLGGDLKLALAWNKPLEEYTEAKALGIQTRPTLLGPVSFLRLSKVYDGSSSPLSHSGALARIYAQILQSLHKAGAEWVQIDEPCLCLDLDDATRDVYQEAYATLAATSGIPKLLLATYFGGLDDNLTCATTLPVQGLHVDAVRAPGQVKDVVAALPKSMTLSLGVVDGRNVWRTDLDAALALVQGAVDKLGAERLIVAPSCSLLHCPIDAADETEMPAQVRSWLAFAQQKLLELGALRDAAATPTRPRPALFEATRAALQDRAQAPLLHRDDVAARLAQVTDGMRRRQHPYAQRRGAQRAALKLPPFPTTTIGSFPQTNEVRAARQSFRRGDATASQYETFLREQTLATLRFQEQIGLDMLVHGEFERTDMVEYFGAQLDGFVFTQHGWVQSYGSRCVKPPIIFGDVARPKPMTVAWSRWAQAQTQKPVKGMLTGPVTILQWSFVRDDQPRPKTCAQLAWALRDEVQDLEGAGIRAIQVDEPALREGLPLRRAQQADYLDWAVKSFALATSGVRDATQIHTHMCYSEFNEIMAAVAALDADVLSIEASRSKMELLQAFKEIGYPNEVGPGVYDIHAPRVPSQGELAHLLRLAAASLRPEQLWVNPDCGLKTRDWQEVRPALTALVDAARGLRREYFDKDVAVA